MQAFKSIKSVALIGAGNQGPKIAFRCVVSGLSVTLYDIFENSLVKAAESIDLWFRQRQDLKQLTDSAIAEARTRLKICSDFESALAGADLIIETIPEKLDLKKAIICKIERCVPEDALVATNSSSIPCSLIADEMNHPERLFNINFSNPQDPDDYLVELMRGADTDVEAILAGEGFVRSLGMVPVVTLKEIMGFSFNRTWRVVKREVLHLADRGHTSPDDLDRAWMLQFGCPWGPFGLMDIIGIDTVRDIENQYYHHSGDERDKPPGLLDEMISQGRLGVKTNQGFYSYPNPDYESTDWLMKKGPWKDELCNRLASEENE